MIGGPGFGAHVGVSDINKLLLGWSAGIVLGVAAVVAYCWLFPV